MFKSLVTIDGVDGNSKDADIDTPSNEPRNLRNAHFEEY